LATAASQAGSAVAYGALPLVAVLVLDASAFQVSLLSALSGLAAAAVGIGLGPRIEFRPKRPAMIAADMVRFATLASVPLAGVLDGLTYAHLCAVAMVSASSELAFNAASSAHLKALVRPEARLTATSRLETTNWTALTAGPPLGGALVSAVGPTFTIAIDAVSYLLSALGIRSIRSPEPPPPSRVEQHWLANVTAGWRFIFRHPGLRALFLNSLLFGACVLAVSPLETVFMLRDLGLEPWAYGLAMGLSCVGGILGAMCTPPLAQRFGERAVLLGTGSLRTVWILLIALAPAGVGGLLVITAANFGLLFSAGIFNPTFVAYRLRESGDEHVARVHAAWLVTTRTVIPLGVLAAGALAAATSPRTAIAVAGGVLLLSSGLLPWRSTVTKNPTCE
jgi:MFS family permease